MNRTTSLGTTASALLASASLAGLLMASPALAQASGPAPATPVAAPDNGGIETVLVTAQRRSERELDVPLTVSVLNADQLKNAGANSLADIATMTPSVRFDYSGAFAQPTIRGIGSAIITSGAGSNVGVYVDGFYNPAPLGINSQLLNVSNVQVLKGPQGTLFGHNTTGGAILVSTSKPSQETSGTLDVSYGNYNAQKYQGYFTTGITDDLSVDIAGLLTKGDGYVTDISNGKDDVGAYQNFTIRAGIEYDPTEDLSFLFRYQHTGINDPTNYLVNAYSIGGVGQVPAAFFGPIGAYTSQPRKVVGESGAFQPIFRSFSNTFQLTSTVNLDFATLTSYTQYSQQSSRTQNENLTASDINPVPGVYLPIVQINIPNIGTSLLTQEFLLNSNSEGRLKWTAGAFYMNWTDRFGADLSSAGGPYASTGRSGTDTVSLAAYANAEYEVLDDLYLQAGLRFSHEEVQDAFDAGFHDPSDPAKVLNLYLPNLQSDRLSPRAVLRYNINPDSNVYFSFSRGFKAPIYNVGGAQTAPVKPESIDAYELGYKYAANALSFDLATYYYDYTNLQVASYQTINGVPVSETSNAASSRIYGVEGNMQYQVTDAFHIDAGAAYTNAKYSSFKGDPYYARCVDLAGCNGLPFGFFTSDPVDERNLDMVRAPEFTANLGAQYNMPLYGGDLLLAGQLYYTSSFYFDSSDEYKQGGYALLDLRAAWTDPSGMYTLAVFGNNVTGTDYRTQVLANNTGIGQVWGPPAMYGGEVTFHFD
jgi:iron complex outermembrane receptor protein